LARTTVTETFVFATNPIDVNKLVNIVPLRPSFTRISAEPQV